MSGYGTSGGGNLDQAVDALAAVLREYGRHAFDVGGVEADDTASLCEAWARHVLLAVPIGGETPAPDGRRDWFSLHGFFSEHRRREKEYVSGALAGVREAVPAVLDGLRGVVEGVGAADSKIVARLDALRRAAVEGDAETLRREAGAAADTVAALISERQHRSAEQINALEARLEELTRQLRQARAESSLDPLTRLDNRKGFETHMVQTLELHAECPLQACLLMIDADRFKGINDTYGHTTGDIVLKTLANCITRTFVGPDDCLARYGGEEFAVILRDISEAAAARLADRLMETVRAARVEVGGKTICFTISIGLSALQADDTSTTWVSRADAALYRAKQTGRDRCVMG